jgi:hypothetical protein
MTGAWQLAKQQHFNELPRPELAAIAPANINPI